MSDDPHAPTNAGPDPDEGAGGQPEAGVPQPVADAERPVEGAAEPAPADQAPGAGPEPTPVVAPSEASWSTPPGSAAPASPAAGQRPEVEVGLAFAGGAAAALLLKVLTR